MANATTGQRLSKVEEIRAIFANIIIDIKQCHYSTLLYRTIRIQTNRKINLAYQNEILGNFNLSAKLEFQRIQWNFVVRIAKMFCFSTKNAGVFESIEKYKVNLSSNRILVIRSPTFNRKQSTLSIYHIS